MNNKNKISIAAVFLSFVLLTYHSISAVFIGMILGLLILPPAIVFISVVKIGLPLMAELFMDIVRSGKGFLVISNSKEYITLQPEFK